MAEVEEVAERQRAGYNKDGPTATRVFKITGITPGTTLLTAITTLSVPQYGDLHPSTGGSPPVILDIYALDISAEFIDAENTMAEVVVNYARPDSSDQEASTEIANAIIQVGSTVSSVKTNKDAAGNSIIVALSGQENQLAELDVEEANVVIVFQRREGVSPFQKAAQYVKKINSGSHGGGAFAAETLLCIAIEGDSDDNGITWNVTYRFQYKPDGWNNQVVVYIDPDTDRPHASVDLTTPGAGWVEADLYEAVNFDPLNLNW